MENIKQINTQFDTLHTSRNDILELFTEITNNISKVNKVYIDLVKTHHNKEHLFGLDSFLFQNKLFEMEYENMRKVFNSIQNRMYCEYYKVYKYIQDYVVNDIKYTKIVEKLAHNNYPVYKDLEPTKVYEFETLRDVYYAIINDKEQITMGINIDNIVNNQQFTNVLLSERITMYIKYLEVINKHHTKYIGRLILKCKLLIELFNEDIQIKHIKQMKDDKKDDNKDDKKEDDNKSENIVV